jgi:L-lactate dehydrogenase complex protein LldE
VRIALFVTCFNDTLFPGTGRAVVALLERLGHTVEFPQEQTCCGQMHGNTGYAEEATALARRFVRVFELSELLVDELGIEDVGATFAHRVTYHPTCHSLRLLEVGDRPLRLLRAVRGIELVELPDAQECCGFGGTFAVKNADVSSAILTDKLRHVMGTRAEVCVAADNSCLMHMGGALTRLRAGVRTMHLAEVLASTA